MRWIPSMLTLCGLACGLAGVVCWPSTRMLGAALLVASLLLDFLDGLAARALHACSVLGRHLDWSVDVALASAIAWRLLPGALALVVVPGVVVLQVISLRHMEDVRRGVPNRGEIRCSGRALVTCLALVAGALP